MVIAEIDEILADLVAVANGEEFRPSLDGFRTAVGDFRARATVIQLISWLWYRGRSPFDRPLSLPGKQPASDAIPQMLRSIRALDTLLELRDAQLDYSGDLSKEIEQRIENYVLSHFRPPFRT
jgi:hypothetical protein